MAAVTLCVYTLRRLMAKIWSMKSWIKLIRKAFESSFDEADTQVEASKRIIMTSVKLKNN